MRTFILVLPKIGLVLNFIGTLLLAFSVGSIPQALTYSDDQGKDVDVALVKSPRLFRFGVGLIAVGFLAQLVM